MNNLNTNSLAGEWLTEMANTNMWAYKHEKHKHTKITHTQTHTHKLQIKIWFQIAPVFILMEHECLKKMREIIG